MIRFCLIFYYLWSKKKNFGGKYLFLWQILFWSVTLMNKFNRLSFYQKTIPVLDSSPNFI